MRKAEVYYNYNEQDYPYIVKILVLESGVGVGLILPPAPDERKSDIVAYV